MASGLEDGVRSAADAIASLGEASSEAIQDAARSITATSAQHIEAIQRASSTWSEVGSLTTEWTDGHVTRRPIRSDRHLIRPQTTRWVTGFDFGDSSTTSQSYTVLMGDRSGAVQVNPGREEGEGDA